MELKRPPVAAFSRKRFFLCTKEKPMPAAHLHTPPVSLIVAAADNGAIGLNGTLPWHLPDDLQFFKATTLGHAILMGRTTYQGIGRPLPQRTNIVLSRQPGYSVPGCMVAADLPSALVMAQSLGHSQVFITGGVQLFEQALSANLASTLYLTRVHGNPAADSYLPAIDWAQWQLVWEQRHAADARHQYAFTFARYERKG